MSGQKERAVLAYRTNDELRIICRQEIETLEHWARRIIHEVLTENYGDDYISYKNEKGEPLIKGEIVKRINKMHVDNQSRFPRPIDATLLSDIIYFLCKDSFYDNHFRNALIEIYPSGKEEARFYLKKIEEIRNKLSHANPISMREAEQVICYCHDFIDGIKMYYKKIGKEKDYNVPTFIRAIDSQGNSFLRSDGVGPLERCIDPLKHRTGNDLIIRLRAGDIYSMSVVVDPAFDVSQYSLFWEVSSGYSENNYKEKYENTTKIDILIENKMVGSVLRIKCTLISKKDWHKHNTYDDIFEYSMYEILPPIEDSY